VPIKVHQRYMLKNKDIKELRDVLTQQFGEENVNTILAGKPTIELLKLDNHEELISVKDKIVFWLSNNRYIPVMTLLIDPNIPFSMRYVTVDKGAIPYVSKGADVMRPGILKIDPLIKKNDLIKIQDPQYGRALAVGEALYDAAEMEAMDKGKVIQYRHGVSDEIWAYARDFK
jgi:PUA-domain protein